MRLNRTFAFAAVSLLGLTQPAFAQDSAEGEEADKDEIVVTGTNIRGAAPVGSNVLSVGPERLRKPPRNRRTSCLPRSRRLPTISTVCRFPTLAIAVNQIQISRPNLRNISGNNAASSATLILVDGHRIATAGVNQASIDPDLIPTGAIARVEVMTEGGSAIYGADAVAGVINFITHKRFDGIKVDAPLWLCRRLLAVGCQRHCGQDLGQRLGLGVLFLHQE